MATRLPPGHLGLRSTSKDRVTLAAPGHPWRVTEPVPGDARAARWEIEISVRLTARLGATVEVARRQPDGSWRWVIDQPAVLP